MKPSADAARVYAILALTAAGRTVNRRALEDICALIGVPVDPDWVRAMLLLLGELAGDPLSEGSGSALNSAPPEPPTDTPAALVPSPHAQSDMSGPDMADVPYENPPELEPAFYVYGFVRGDAPGLGLHGIEGKTVVAVRIGHLAALGHACPAAPYASPDESILLGWITEHDSVLASAMEVYEAVVPCRFNTLFKSGVLSAVDTVRGWLTHHSDELLAAAQRVEDRREYVVRVRWDEGVARARLMRALDGELGVRDDEELSDGLRYLNNERTRRDLTSRYQMERSAIGHRIIDALASVAEEHIEEGITSDMEEDGTVLRCAFLVHIGRAEAFKESLHRLEETEQVEIEVSGPWPAYSFVNRQGGAGA